MGFVEGQGIVGVVEGDMFDVFGGAEVWEELHDWVSLIPVPDEHQLLSNLNFIKRIKYWNNKIIAYLFYIIKGCGRIRLRRMLRRQFSSPETQTSEPRSSWIFQK